MFPTLGLTVLAPVTGTVTQVLVSQGDSVEIEAALVVIESIGMMHEIRAVQSGNVQQINVKVGDVVQQHQTLMVIQ